VPGRADRGVELRADLSAPVDPAGRQQGHRRPVRRAAHQEGPRHLLLRPAAQLPGFAESAH
jgi:hypothetical protein